MFGPTHPMVSEVIDPQPLPLEGCSLWPHGGLDTLIGSLQ